MSEQKMPALPLREMWTGDVWDAIDRHRRAAYDDGFADGRQQERERLEPLRVAVEALSKADKVVAAVVYLGGDAKVHLRAAAVETERVLSAARTLLEQTE